MANWDAVIRFKSNGLIYWSAISPGDVPELGSIVSASHELGASSTETVVVEELLAPLPSLTNPIICIGTNYHDHAKETGGALPTAPVMWYKPPTALAGPGDVIPISGKFASENFFDYEVGSSSLGGERFRKTLKYRQGELVIVTSKPAKNVSEAEAKDYILGYTIGNDLTLRLFQDPKRCGGQFTFAKSFDKFAPMGPALVSAKSFGIAPKHVETRVNGRILQKSEFDFIHTPEKIISFLSQETTIPAGTAIMTGTPGGVGWFQNPQVSLKDGDIVEVEIKGVGILRNKISFT